MNQELLKVSLRQQALYLPQIKGYGEASVECSEPHPTEMTARTLALVVELRQMGYTLSEDLLHALNDLDEDGQQQVLDVINEVMGTKLNWASLVKGWLTPTGETVWDHFLTLLANLAGRPGNPGNPGNPGIPGTTLPCGHLIPDGTFPLERYNGCPFCGKPFQTADFVYRGQGSKLRLLQLWGDKEIKAFYQDLLLSPVPLDATQRESLKTLLAYYLQTPLPTPPLGREGSASEILTLNITQKETRMMVIDALVEAGRDDEAARLFSSPVDVMRYLWYRHTGHLQLIEPHTLLYIRAKNQRYEWHSTDDIDDSVEARKAELKLKYPRPWCRRVARWLNGLTMPVDQQLEAMHPKREMWVRFFRALRLYEYAKHPGYEQLAELTDRFYRRDYSVWQGRVDHYRLKNDATETLRLLGQRPGLFARCLFSTMLTFGAEQTLTAFRKVMDDVPVRLLLSLTAQAEIYFDRNGQRVARPLSSVTKQIPQHPLLVHYTDEQLTQMQRDIRQLFLDAMRQHFTQHPSPNTQHPSTYIDPQLDHIPMPVGDRSNTVQNASAALQGTRFPVQGDNVRLFLQWGKDLPAQPLDMDLSAYILSETEGTQPSPPPLGARSSRPPQVDTCSYFNLVTQGAKHSGDIRQIPDLVGTAEYIELSLPELHQRGAKQVVFTCNAYTAGELSPNLVVGWMSAEQPMTVDNETGVAYDPSTVDHFVRITQQNLAKGLIFGVLDVSKREITWLEIPFDGQTVLTVSPETVNAYLRRLAQKPTIGQLLRLRAEVQGSRIVDSPEAADEAYTLLWAQNTAQVSRLLMGE